MKYKHHLPIPPCTHAQYTHTCTCVSHTHVHMWNTHTSSSDEEMRSSYPDSGSTAAPGRSVAALCGLPPQGHKWALLSPDSSPGQEAQSTFCFPHLCSAFGLKGCEAALDPHSYQFPDVSTISQPHPHSQIPSRPTKSGSLDVGLRNRGILFSSVFFTATKWV